MQDAQTESPDRPRRIIAVGFLSWLTMLGVDFLIHGGLLASLYAQTSPFLLPPLDAFRKIPIGYLSFLFLAVLLLWLMLRIGISGWREGLLFGLKLGLLTWGALLLGLISISTAPANLMIGWWVGQSVELGIAGAVAGYGLRAERLRFLVLGVIGVVIVSVLITVILQNISFG